MSVDQPSSQAPSNSDLEQMMGSLANISGDLLESYEKLRGHATRMEQELCRANTDLENQVAEVEAILQALPVGVAVLDAEGTVLRVNETLAHILATGKGELVGMAAQDCLPGPEEPGEPFSLSSADGQTRILTRRSAKIVNTDDDQAGRVEIFDDQTEMVQLEERVRQMDKMAALGNMAAGIAHEIRNPLNAVKGFAELFKKSMQPDTRDHRWSSLILSGVVEIEAIISSLLSFSQPEKLRLETIEAQDIVDGALAAALQRTPGQRDPRDWKFTQDCSAGALRCDHIKLRQALRNLISNAMEVQPQGGALHIVAAQSDGSHTFEVQDAGPGVPVSLASRLADPFFTTRASGTGLGLSLVHSIAALHGGALHISCDASPLGGASFQFSIPSTRSPLTTRSCRFNAS